MTVREILKEVDALKPMTRETLYIHIRKLKIKPLSKVRQIPVQYPGDTAHRILLRLGLVKNGGKQRRAA